MPRSQPSQPGSPPAGPGGPGSATLDRPLARLADQASADSLRESAGDAADAHHLPTASITRSSDPHSRTQDRLHRTSRCRPLANLNGAHMVNRMSSVPDPHAELAAADVRAACADSPRDQSR